MSEMPKDGLLAMKPANMTFEEAAALPVGGITAFSLLKKGNIVSEQKVLIYGASGSVGTYAVQLAKHHFGAEVTGVCSTANVELIKSLGADHVIDYKKEDFTENDKTYNVIFDAVNKISSSHCKNSLQKKGHFISVGSTVRENQKDFILLKELAEAEKLKAVIDRTYPMEEIVEAHRYVDTGRKKGNVVITIKTE